MMSSMPAASLFVKVVALGDSLTTGFQSYGSFGNTEISTPYTDILTDRVRRDFLPSSLVVEIDNRGVIGELTEQMLARFSFDVIQLSPKIVIILGGSNDLGWGLDPGEIFSSLRGMYDLSQKSGIVPVACTVPSILGFDEGISPRKVLNNLIVKHSRKSGLRCVDLFSVLADPDTGRLASQYSADGLHLSAGGYRKVGDAIYEDGLEPIIRSIVEAHP